MSKQQRKTLGVVLRTVDYNDNDRMVTLLTKDHGLMGARVKGAKKQTTKLFFAASLFTCGEYGFYEKNGFFGVKSFDLKYSFRRLQDDYDAFAAACVIADAVGKVAQEEDAAPKLFALVVNALYALDISDAPPGTVLCYFLQRLLKIEGLFPSLNACVICGTDAGLTRFSNEHGGAVCTACAKKYGGKIFDSEVVSALAGMDMVMPIEMGKVRIPPRVEKALVRVLIEYLEYTLQKPLKSAKFVKDAL